MLHLSSLTLIIYAEGHVPRSAACQQPAVCVKPPHTGNAPVCCGVIFPPSRVRLILLVPRTGADWFVFVRGLGVCKRNKPESPIKPEMLMLLSFCVGNPVLHPNAFVSGSYPRSGDIQDQPAGQYPATCLEKLSLPKCYREGNRSRA